MPGALLLLLGVAGPKFSVYAGNTITETRAGNAASTIHFLSTGEIEEEHVGTSPTFPDNWIVPTSLAPGAYTIRCHVNSGTLTGGSSAQDTDLALSSGRAWTVAQVGSGTSTASITLTIKDGAGNIMVTGNVTLTAIVP